LGLYKLPLAKASQTQVAMRGHRFRLAYGLHCLAQEDFSSRPRQVQFGALETGHPLTIERHDETTERSGPLLEVSGLCKSFGRLQAVSDVSFTIRAGKIVGIIGPNGAGKTTLLSLLAGATRASKGDIRFAARSIVHLSAHQIGRLGIIRTFQLVQPFSFLTVRECTMLGALFGRAEGHCRTVAEARDYAEAMLKFVGLDRKADAPAEELNIPERKLLELARALAARPILLLLDEVMAGLSAEEMDRMVELLRKERDGGVTIVLVEHIVDVLNALCDRGVVLHHGEKIADGPMNDPAVTAALSRFYMSDRR
jgi:branched-chain amino acid transport system ATP-binding protein